MVLIRTLRLVICFGYANLKSQWNYRGSFFFEVFTSIIHLVISLIFWRVIYSQTKIFAGWSISQLFFLMGFAELFWAFQKGIFNGAFWIPNKVRLGQLERWMASPIDPRFGILLEHNQTFLFLRSLPSVVIWFILGIHESGSLPSFVDILIGILIVAISAAAMSLIVLLIGSLVFWLGQSDILVELSLVLSNWARWPTNVFNTPIRLVLTYIFPIALAATLPVSIIAQKIQWKGVLVLGIIIFIFWYLAQEIVWRRGLKRYEGFGG